MKRYDFLMVGHVSKDVMVYVDQTEQYLGGGVVYAARAAAASGREVLVVTKVAAADRPLLSVFEAPRIEVRVIDSPQSTSIRNVYHSEDRDRRDVTLLSGAEPFRAAELPEVDARIINFAGLFYGEIADDLIPICAARGALAVDAQGLLRRNMGTSMQFVDWERKRELLPHVTYLKVDAAEAEVLTGLTDREAAAAQLREWGAHEVMVTHSSEVIVLTADGLVRAPFTSRNLSGRTGRGDTCFASYLSSRLEHDPGYAVRYAAALTSIKMETPGPFAATPEDVERRMAE